MDTNVHLYAFLSPEPGRPPSTPSATTNFTELPHTNFTHYPILTLLNYLLVAGDGEATIDNVEHTLCRPLIVLRVVHHSCQQQY
jgi:hypothetical protein